MPLLVKHAAALIDISFCEKNKDKSLQVNYKSTKYIVDWIKIHSKEKKTKLIYISTDQVYGSKKFKNIESNSLPLNIYAKPFAVYGCLFEML